MTDETECGRLSDWLANHPRMLGALFLLGILLMQASGTVAASSNAHAGP